MNIFFINPLFLLSDSFYILQYVQKLTKNFLYKSISAPYVKESYLHALLSAKNCLSQRLESHFGVIHLFYPSLLVSHKNLFIPSPNNNRWLFTYLSDHLSDFSFLQTYSYTNFGIIQYYFQIFHFSDSTLLLTISTLMNSNNICQKRLAITAQKVDIVCSSSCDDTKITRKLQSNHQ